METEQTHRTNIQLKIISLKQVCLKYMLIFMLSIYNCYNEVYKMAKKSDRRRKL